MRMHQFRSSLAAIAGVGIFFAVLHTEFLIAWFCMVPLFASVEGATLRVAARLGFITGAVLSACGFYWMIAGAEKFTGSSAWYGLGVFALCLLVFSLYWSLLLLAFAWWKKGRGPLTSALLAGSLWVCAEAGLQG